MKVKVKISGEEFSGYLEEMSTSRVRFLGEPEPDFYDMKIESDTIGGLIFYLQAVPTHAIEFLDSEPRKKKMDHMTFGEALEVLRNGGKCRREEWDYTEYLYRVPRIRKTDGGYFSFGCECPNSLTPQIYYRCVKGNMCGEWNPCTYDLLAKDWMVVE